MTLKEIYDRARVARDSIDVRIVKPNTHQMYLSTFYRMLQEPQFDPLRPGDSRGTYNLRRSSLAYGLRHALSRLLEDMLQEVRKGRYERLQVTAAALLRLLDLMEGALERDPPLAAGQSPFERGPSRWQETARSKEKRGKSRKRDILPKLPKDWRERMWSKVVDASPYKPAVAVMCLSPCRGAELVPGVRSTRYSPGVRVRLANQHELHIQVEPVKTHNGVYGSPECGLVMNPALEGDAAAYLTELCNRNGGEITVAVGSADSLRKAVKRLSGLALPNLPCVTPRVFRAQGIADLKATFGAGGEVAAGSGHCTDRTQSGYGRVIHGRSRRGLLRVWTKRVPRVGSAERARSLGAARKAAPMRPPS